MSAVTPAVDAGELTIIVPVFNRDEPLRRAIASIGRQSGPLSIIIVDDGSSPDFAGIVDEIALTVDGEVRVVHQTNRGAAPARNRGLALCRTPFVMFLDSDDELTDTALDTIEKHLFGRSEVGMVCGAVHVVRQDGSRNVSYPDASAGVPWARLSHLAGSFAVRTDLALAVGGYDETLSLSENTDFILRLAEACRNRSLEVAATDDVLCIYNRRDGTGVRYAAQCLDAAIHLLRRGRFDLDHPTERARLHAIAAVNAGRLGRYPLSVKHAALAARTEPRHARNFGRLALSLTGPLARRRWSRKAD